MLTECMSMNIKILTHGSNKTCKKYVNFVGRLKMSSRIYILLIVLTGFLLNPSVTNACGKSHSKTEKSCCAIKKSQTEKESFTKNKDAHSNKDCGSCGGKCGHTSCHCAPVFFSCILPYTLETYLNLLLAFKKPHFAETDPYNSSGFQSTWLPPKIG